MEQQTAILLLDDCHVTAILGLVEPIICLFDYFFHRSELLLRRNHSTLSP
jgi:hypothetical protein